MKKIVTTANRIGRFIEVLAGFFGGVIVAVAIGLVTWHFRSSGLIGITAFCLICGSAFVLFPLAALLNTRRFILFFEPFANLLTMGSPTDAEDDWKDFLMLGAYCFSLIALLVGAIFHLWIPLVIGGIIFAVYGISAPHILELKLESDTPKAEQVGGGDAENPRR